MLIRLRSLSRAELTRFNLQVADAWELDTNLIPRAYSPFKMADRHGEKQVIEHKQ